MPLIDTILDAQNETTDEFTAEDVGPHFANAAQTFIQGVREGGSTDITLAFEGCIPTAAGRKTWHEIATFDVDGASGSAEILHRTDIHRGCVFRIRYDSSATDRIRVLVSAAQPPVTRPFIAPAPAGLGNYDRLRSSRAGSIPSQAGGGSRGPWVLQFTAQTGAVQGSNYDLFEGEGGNMEGTRLASFPTDMFPTAGQFYAIERIRIHPTADVNQLSLHRGSATVPQSDFLSNASDSWVWVVINETDETWIVFRANATESVGSGFVVYDQDHADFELIAASNSDADDMETVTHNSGAQFIFALIADPTFRPSF